MIAVIFEVRTKENCSDRYFELAGELREKLNQVDGFISIERFQSLSFDNKFLSLSFWRDTEAVENWYLNQDHRAAQEEGRKNIFDDYQIHVTKVLRNYDMTSGRPTSST